MSLHLLDAHIRALPAKTSMKDDGRSLSPQGGHGVRVEGVGKGLG